MAQTWTNQACTLGPWNSIGRYDSLQFQTSEVTVSLNRTVTSAALTYRRPWMKDKDRDGSE